MKLTKCPICRTENYYLEYSGFYQCSKCDLVLNSTQAEWLLNMVIPITLSKQERIDWLKEKLSNEKNTP